MNNKSAHMHTGTLYIVATPIGNLSDMSPRATDTLQSVDLILCEDTRVSKKLFSHFDISTPLKSFHQHSSEKVSQDIKQLLVEGKHIALVSDAGTPAISDPGGLLVQYISEQGLDIEIIAIPGPSAVVAALSVSGFSAERFLFLGFPPHKQKRKQFFEQVLESSYTCAFYESPYRISKALKQLAELGDPQRKICVCREISKKFESRYRGTIEEVLAMDIPEKGEFVVVVEGRK